MTNVLCQLVRISKGQKVSLHSDTYIYVGSSVAEWLACSTQAYEGLGSNQIAAATLSGNSLRQTVHTHRASVHQAAKKAVALLRYARVTTGLAESNGTTAGFMTHVTCRLTAKNRDRLRVWATFTSYVCECLTNLLCQLAYRRFSYVPRCVVSSFSFYCTSKGQENTFCVHLLACTYADNGILPAIAGRTPRQTIDISYSPGPQQQTRRSLLGEWDRQTDRRTETVQFHRACCARSANNERYATVCSAWQ